ncbi:hypothetical protein HRbin25_00032 [bacterium HR25]|nr:hypothetical protein HRbin25_00032 [bacterium HR25]
MDQQPARVESPPEQFFRIAQQPRILLLMLAGWDILAAVAEFFASGAFFLGLGERELNGVLAGRVLSWQSIPLAVVYLYVSRRPAAYPRIFWLALIEQSAAIAANIYHFGAGDLALRSILLPVAVSAALLALVILNIFPREGPNPGPAATR